MALVAISTSSVNFCGHGDDWGREGKQSISFRYPQCCSIEPRFQSQQGNISQQPVDFMNETKSVI